MSIEGGNAEATIQGISTCGNAEITLDNKSKINIKDCGEDAFERVAMTSIPKTKSMCSTT